MISVTGSNIALANANPFRYRSYYYDTDTGMYYLQSRYYDPEICRFINADDANYLLFSNNAFSYCENNPVLYDDPEGTLSINCDLLVFLLDVAFTAIASWVKFGYDIIGAGLKLYFQKHGYKLFYERLMKVVVPKFRG